MRAANKRESQAQIDERGRRANAAKRARRLAEMQADAMPVVEADGGPRIVRQVDAELVPPGSQGRHARGAQGALPAAADRRPRAGLDVRRVAARSGLVLRAAGDALRHLLPRDGLHPEAARRLPLLRPPPVHRHRLRALLLRDLERRHPLDLDEPPAGQEDADAARDLPGGLDGGGRLPHAAADPRARLLLPAGRLAPHLERRRGRHPGPRAAGDVLRGPGAVLRRAERVLPRLPEHRRRRCCSSCTSWCR